MAASSHIGPPPGNQDRIDARRRTSAFRAIAVVLLLALCGYFLGGFLEHPGTALTVPEEVLDFGSAWAAKDFNWTMPITNRSHEPVRIERFLSSCVCAAVEPQPLVIGPGETEDVRMVLNLLAIQPDTLVEDAPFELNVRPVLEGPGVQPHPGWILRGRVKVPFTVSTTNLSFGEFVATVPPSGRSCVLKHRIPLSEVLAEYDAECLNVTVESMEDRTTVLRVAPNTGLVAGGLNSDIALRAVTDAGDVCPPIYVRVTGDVLPDIHAVPRRCAFGVVTASSTLVDDSVILRSGSGQRFSVLHIETDGPTEVTVFPRTSAAEHRLHITHHALGAGSQVTTVELTAQLGDGTTRVIELPLTYYALSVGTIEQTSSAVHQSAADHPSLPQERSHVH